MGIRNLAQLAMLVLGLAVITLACGGGDGERSVEGVILEVESNSLVELDSFTLRSNDGETFVFVSDPNVPGDPQEGIFPGHLLGHMQVAEQVTVYYRDERGELLAIRIGHD